MTASITVEFVIPKDSAQPTVMTVTDNEDGRTKRFHVDGQAAMSRVLRFMQHSEELVDE